MRKVQSKTTLKTKMISSMRNTVRSPLKTQPGRANRKRITTTNALMKSPTETKMRTRIKSKIGKRKVPKEDERIKGSNSMKLPSKKLMKP